jgi:hypothetical protein
MQGKKRTKKEKEREEDRQKKKEKREHDRKWRKERRENMEGNTDNKWREECS